LETDSIQPLLLTPLLSWFLFYPPKKDDNRNSYDHRLSLKWTA